ncbi:uncharacterized protein LOC132446723 [Gadus macrocephalus]|uniref:uncharacterized protein LOC132446723 n=1 Tax=Gadus macrocephalus TaxID=80720 RepID=UPI0028CB5E54|nr:uncharacterized protein LOC132446723 [Gadus macrocephalus]
MTLWAQRFAGSVGESAKHQLGPHGSSNDIWLDIQQTILADQTNVLTSGSFVPIAATVNQRSPGLSRLSKKRPAGIDAAIAGSSLTIEQPQIPYKKTRKDAAHSAIAPENFNHVIQAVINPQIAQHGAVWSDAKRQVIGAVEVHVPASPTEIVTVQPNGAIQHVLEDPQCAPSPVVTAYDLEGLDDILSWTSSFLEHRDFTPAQWIDSPATSLGATSAETVQHQQPADPPSGSLHALQDPSGDPQCIVSLSTQEVSVPLLPAAPVIAVDEHHAGVQCAKWRKEFADKLALLTASVDVNSLTIARQSKLSVAAAKSVDIRYQTLEKQTKQSFITIRGEIASDRHQNPVLKKTYGELWVQFHLKVKALKKDHGLRVVVMWECVMGS